MVPDFQSILSIRENTDGIEHQTETQKRDIYVILEGS